MVHARPSSLNDHPLDAIVIGGSAGVLEVLRVIFSALPEALSIPVIVVVHLPSRSHSLVHQSLQSSTSLPMSQADDKEPLEGGRIYFASPGYHLLIAPDRSAALSIDEPVFYSRPSIDVLFDAASDVYRARLLGILLTGASADGAAGLQSIHDRRGITIVQRPDTCEAATMPLAALDLFQPDYVLAPSAIATLLATLTTDASISNLP